MENEDNIFNTKEEETFSFFTDVLAKLKLKEDDIADKKVENHTDLYSKAHSNLADLELLLMQLKSTSEFLPHEKEADLVTNKENDIDLKKGPQVESLIEQSLQAEKSKIEEDPVTNAEDNKSFYDIKEAESISFKEEENFEDVRDTIEENRVELNIEPEELKYETIDEIEEVSELIINHDFELNSKFETEKIDVEIKDQMEEILNLREEVMQNNEINSQYKKEEIEDNIDDIPELNEEIKFNSCIEIEPIKEESEKEVEEIEVLTEEIKSISFMEIEPIIVENKNEIEEVSELTEEIKLNSQQEISCNDAEDQRLNCSRSELVDERHNDENEAIEIKAEKDEIEIKTNELIEKLDTSSEEIEAISINEIEEDKTEKNEIISDSKVEFHDVEEINKTENSNEFKYSVLSEIDISKDHANKEIQEINHEEKDYLKEIIKESAELGIQKIYEENEIINLKEDLPISNENLENKTINEDIENKSIYELSDHKDTIAENPNDRLAQLIAEMENNGKPYSSDEPKETSTSNILNLSLVKETSYKASPGHVIPDDDALETVEKQEETNYHYTKIEPSSEPDLKESATFLAEQMEKFQVQIEAPLDVKETSTYSLNNKSNEIINEIPTANNQQYISFEPFKEQLNDGLDPSIEEIEANTSKLLNEPKENIKEFPNLLEQLDPIQPDSDLCQLEFQDKPNESFEFKQPIHESKIENVFELAKNAILLEQSKSIDKITPLCEDKKETLSSYVPPQVYYNSPIKTPFDDDDDIEEIPEIKYTYQKEESKHDSSGIVNYQRLSDPRENILSSNMVINEFENKKMNVINLLECNHTNSESIPTALNIDQKDSKSSNILIDNNPSNNFFNPKTNPYYDPYQLNKSEYSVANSMIINHTDPIKILASYPKITKEIQQNENNVEYSNQIKNPVYFLTDNSGINYNDKSEQIEFDVKEMTTIPEALPESKQQYEVKKEDDSFRVGSEFKFSHEEIKQSNMTNMSNILAERKLSDLKKADMKSKYPYEDHHDIDIDDFNDFEEVHNLTGNDFNKNESKNKIKSPFTNDRKYSNVINANKKNENLNSSNDKFNDKSGKEIKQANDKYQNFRTEDYESNNILLELNKEPGSPAPELVENFISKKNSFVNQAPQNGAKENYKIIEENKSYHDKSRKSINSKKRSIQEIKNQTQIRLPQDLTIINYFTMKEIKFNESIPNFSSIFLEKNFIFKRRRNSFLNNHFYEEHILKEFNIIDRYKAIPKDFQQVLEEGLKKYEQSTDFQNIFEEALRNSDKTAEMKKRIKNSNKEDPLIGELKPISIYLEDKESETVESKKSFYSLSEAMPYWRESIADGDSFYRLFIFGLLEHYILTKNIREIKKIILDICNVNDYFSENLEDKSKKVDLTNTLLVFYFILDHLENNNIHEAYQVLTRSYHLSENEFDKKLIDYMRRIIWMNIYETEKELSLKKDYSQEKNLKLEYDPIRIDPILVFQNEPNKLPISLIPLIFNVDLDIYILDGSLGTQSEIKYMKKSFTNYKPINSSVTTISLFYNMSSYHKAYTEDYIKIHEELLSPLVKHEDTRADISLGNKLHCEVCMIKTDHAIYNRYSNTAFCVECAKTYVNTSLDKRAKIHTIENFHNREYYSRSFQLKQDIFLNDSDIYKLYNTNIANLFLKAIKNLCFFCNIKQENDLHTLSCYCQICNTCLDQILKLYDSIQVSTRKKMSTPILNNLFKLGTSKLSCACNITFDVKAAISMLSSTDRKLSGKESNRDIDDFKSRYCMKCCNVMINKGDEIAIPTTNQVFQKFHIVDEDSQKIGKDFSKGQHVLCYYCIDKILKQESEENLRRRNSGNKFIKKKDHKLIECNICKCNHKILLTEWNRANNKATCCEGCLIM